MLLPVAAYLIFDQALELKSQDYRTAEGIAPDALPLILVMKQIEVVAGVARGVDVYLLEDESLRQFGFAHTDLPVVRVQTK